MDYYVYRHLKKDSRMPFYVGKGRGYRHTNLNYRSIFHKRIVEKHGVIIQIVATGLSSKEALELESKLIKLYRTHGLAEANLTEGGEGRPSGYKVSNETKEKIRLANLGKTKSLETRLKKAESMRLYHARRKLESA